MNGTGPGILLLTNEFRPIGGGIATYCHEMVLALQRADAGITVIAADKGPDPSAFDAVQPYAIHRTRDYPFALRRHANRLRALRHTVITNAPDWLWASDWRTGLVVAQVAARQQLPYVVSAYGSELLSARRRLLRRFLARQVFVKARTVVSISSYTSDLLRALGVPAAQITLISPGADPDGWQVTPAQVAAVRARHGLAERPVILTLARIAARKGHDVVLSALPEVLEQVPNAVYLIAGAGDERTRLEQLVRSQGLDRNVIFTGFVPESEKAAYYAACDVSVLLSRREGDDVEGFGITLLEAAACAKPVVAGDHGGVRDAVVSGETGLLVDPRQPKQVSAALLRLLTDDQLAAAMGLRARRRVEREANWTNAAQKFLAALHAPRDNV